MIIAVPKNILPKATTLLSIVINACFDNSIFSMGKRIFWRKRETISTKKYKSKNKIKS